MFEIIISMFGVWALMRKETNRFERRGWAVLIISSVTLLQMVFLSAIFAGQAYGTELNVDWQSGETKIEQGILLFTQGLFERGAGYQSWWLDKAPSLWILPVWIWLVVTLYGCSCLFVGWYIRWKSKR